MITHCLTRLAGKMAPLTFATLGLAGLLSSPAARAQSTYTVFVNTSSVAAQSGFLDIQFNPGNASALGATVTITGFSQTPTNTMAPMATDVGGAGGSLPGKVTIANSGGFNDLFQGLTYGSTFSFVTTFSGPALSPGSPLPASGSTFSIALYGSNGSTPLLTTNGNGDLFDINVNPNGSTSVVNYSTAGSAVVTPALAPVPEPSGLLCGIVGMAGVGWLICRKRRLAYNA